jgi:triacylglycerol lipase
MTIEELARTLALRIRRDAPASNYVAVTHSLGGIIVRHMRDALPWRGLVMLAPPNRGSRLALALRELPLYRWLYGPAGQDVTRPDQWPLPPTPFAVVAGTRSASLSNPVSWVTKSARFFPPDSPNDGTISVDETKLDGMSEHALVDASHTFIMNHPEARRIVLRLVASYAISQ